MTLREALGGRWSTHWALWLALYPGAIALILLRESTTDYPEPWWPILSATVQHLVSGTVVVAGGAIARRRSAVLPVWVVIALWALACVVRAAIGATVAEVVAGVPGHFFFRVGSWLLVSAVWLTALVYGIAQIERRRQLIGELEQAQRRLERATELATESSEAMQTRLASTVRASVAPSSTTCSIDSCTCGRSSTRGRSPRSASGSPPSTTRRPTSCSPSPRCPQ